MLLSNQVREKKFDILKKNEVTDIDISDLISDSEVFDDYDFGEDTCGEKMYDSDDDYDEFY